MFNRVEKGENGGKWRKWGKWGKWRKWRKWRKKKTLVIKYNHSPIERLALFFIDYPPNGSTYFIMHFAKKVSS